MIIRLDQDQTSICDVPEGTASKKESGLRSRGRDFVALHFSLGTPKGSMAWCCLPVVSQLLIACEY